MTKNITQLPAGVAPTGDEVLPAIQDGVDVKLSVDDILASAVRTTGPQAIIGTKNFFESPVVPNATAAGHVPNLAQVESLVTAAGAGGSLPPAKVVGIFNYSTGAGALPVFDGYQVVNGDRVLLTAQTDATTNGPWVANSAGWSRPADFAVGSSQAGKSIAIAGGTIYKGSVWVLNSTGTVTVGGSPQTWIRDNTAVRTSGSQSVAGIKNFTNGIIVPDSSLPKSAVSGLQADLDGKVDESLATAAGHLFVASASGTITGLAVGTRGQVLTASPIPGVKVRWEPKPKIHIRDHNAILDGASDTRQAFIDAIAALPTHGGVVQFGPDIPVVYSTIPVARQNVTIEGIGKALVASPLLPTSCIYYTGTGPLFDFSDSISSGLENVAIRGTNTAGSKGVYGTNMTNVFLRDVWVDGMAEQGIHLVSGVHCQVENVWVESVLLVATGRTAYVGAVDIGTTDAHLHNVIASIGNASGIGTGWRAAIVLRSAPWNMNACIGQVSEAGIVIETNATNGRCGSGTRADFNFGHGWVIKGAGNVFVAPLAHHNSTDAALQGAGQGGDGFHVTGGKNTFIAPIISEIFGSTTKQRDGIRDTCSDDTANPKSGNVYAFTRCEPTDIRGDVENITGTAQHNVTEAHGGNLRVLRGGVHVRSGDVEDVQAQDDWDPIAANNNAAYAAAITAASAAGGGQVLLPPLLKLSSAVEIPDSVNLRGRGSSQGGGGSIIELTAASAQVRFGNADSGASGSSGGLSEGFRIDGGGVANIPFYAGITVGRSFKNIDIVDAVDAGMLLEATQNCDFEEVNVQNCGNDCLRIDKGSGSNHFGKCEYGQAGRYNLNIVETTATGLPLFVQPGPLSNVWNDGCIFEYDKATTLAMVHVSGGSENTIDNCIIVAPQYARTLVHLEVAGVATFTTFRLRGGTCQFNYVHADTTVLNQSGNSRFYQEGVTSVAGATTIGRYAGGSAIARWSSPVIPPAAVWAVLSGGAPYYNIRSTIDTADAIAIAGPGTYTKRRAVFDANGNVEGYLHIFDE